MAKSLNEVKLIGNLGQDPDFKCLPNDIAVVNFTLATSKKWKDKQTGEQKEKPQWHKIVIFGGLAKVAAEYLRKGSKVYLSGEIDTRKWTNQQGQDQYITEIIASEMIMLDGNNNSQGQQGGYQQQAPQQQGGFVQQGHQQAPQQNYPQQGHQQAPQQNYPQQGRQ